MERAIDSRRAEFATARACARAALRRLGHPECAIPVGPRGEPRWPPGVVGSITHCAGYRAGAVASQADLLALGIDAEPNEPLPERIAAEVASEEELASIRRLAHAAPDVRWDRLLFSAKEAVYKAWFPLTHDRLGFDDAVLSIDAGTRTFSARLRVSKARLPSGEEPRALTGKWAVADGLILTAVAVVPARREHG